MRKAGKIRVGVGGWIYRPWRTTFYPRGLAQKRELEFASRQVTLIEINCTNYRTQSPASFAKWHDETPRDFVFSVKAPHYATNRRMLAEAGATIERFLNSGLSRLGAKLGPLLWQFAPQKRFEPEEFECFLKLLPTEFRGRRLRHALEVRHPSFLTPGFLALARAYGAATVFADSDEYQSFADLTADFVYARLMRADAAIETGYSDKAMATWVKRVRAWASGGEPTGLMHVDTTKAQVEPRDVFVLFINGAKERAPAAARELIARLNS